jgi:hypothetical protein
MNTVLRGIYVKDVRHGFLTIDWTKHITVYGVESSFFCITYELVAVADAL